MDKNYAKEGNFTSDTFEKTIYIISYLNLFTKSGYCRSAQL